MSTDEQALGPEAWLDVHREAHRLGDVPPAHALLAIAEHAKAERPRFDALVAKRQPMRLDCSSTFTGASDRQTLLACNSPVTVTKISN